jgi:hypothetical protein
LPIGIVSFLFSRKVFKKLTRLLSKIDTFDALIRLKREISYIYTTKISVLGSRLRKQKVNDLPKHIPVPHTPTIDDIIKSKPSVSRYADP